MKYTLYPPNRSDSSSNSAKVMIVARSIQLPILAVTSAFLFSSCNLSQEKAALLGGAAGAAIGGVAGNKLSRGGDRTAATIGGVVAGAAIGSGIAKKHADPQVVRVRRGN